MTSRMCRVLVVDGDEEVRNVIEDLLIDRGFEVHQAANADEAVLELRGNPFDVLLCHLALLRSVRSGLNQRVRALHPTPRVVAMSASGTPARSDEANASLSKPFSRSQLLDALRPAKPGPPVSHREPRAPFAGASRSRTACGERGRPL